MSNHSLAAEASVEAHRAALEARVAALPSPQVILASTALTAGGVWRNVRDLGVLLQSIGVDVTIALPRDATALQEAARRVGLPSGEFTVLARRRCAVWHAHLHNTYDLRVFATAWKRRFVGPTAITEHLPRNHASDADLEPHHPRTRGAYLAKTLLKQAEFLAADEVIAVGTSSARFLRERYRIPSRKLCVVHNGIEALDHVPITSSPSDPLHVLAIGNLGRQKGFDVLIEAIDHSSRDWKVTIAGDGSQGENLRALSQRSAAGRVEFPGWVDEPQELMRQADVICMPSRWESFPYVALEALAIGRPIVGSRVDGLDEIVDSRTGVLVDPDRPIELATALDRLDADRPLLMRLAEAGPERAAHFTLANMLFGTLDVYERAWRARTRSRSSRWS